VDRLPLVRAGRIRAYAVASDTRSSLAPDIPTFGEMGLPLPFSPPLENLWAVAGGGDGYAP